MNMVWLLPLLYLLCLTAANCQESLEVLALEEASSSVAVAVEVETQHLENVSKSVLMAESWLRNHVLAYYPSLKVSTIVISHTVLCNKHQNQNLGKVLPSIKNIHYSLTRWGLHNHIKVSASISSDCLDSETEGYYRNDLAQTYIKPLLTTLQEMGSPYVVNSMALLESHYKSMKNLGDFHLKNTNVVMGKQRERPSSRKLSSVEPYPPRPTPITPSNPNPAYAATSPLPPLVGVVSPQPYNLPFSPSLPPTNPPPFMPHLAPTANPPFGPHLPPCNPSGGHGSVGAPGPVAMHHNGLWCVAKPSVPHEALQEALDYACGEGGAECEEIQPDGSCFSPDSLVAHASYAFNSYWQKNKKHGGTCGFGGTAMLINSDPSYNHCRFILV